MSISLQFKSLMSLFFVGGLLGTAVAYAEGGKRYEMSVEGFQARVSESEKDIQVEVFNVTSPTPMVVIKSKSTFRKKDGTQVISAEFDHVGPKVKGNKELILNLPKEAKMKRIELRVTQKSIKPYAPLIIWPLP